MSKYGTDRVSIPQDPRSLQRSAHSSHLRPGQAFVNSLLRDPCDPQD